MCTVQNSIPSVTEMAHSLVIRFAVSIQANDSTIALCSSHRWFPFVIQLLINFFYCCCCCFLFIYGMARHIEKYTRVASIPPQIEAFSIDVHAYGVVVRSLDEYWHLLFDAYQNAVFTWYSIIIVILRVGKTELN